MRKCRCLPCKIEGKINYMIAVEDNIPMCKYHYNIWKNELKNIEHYEDFEDSTNI